MVSKKLPDVLVIDGVPIQVNREPEFEPEYLYIEEYPLEPLPKDDNKRQESEEENRGVVVIDLC
jgi:hypothetical protein